MCLWRGFNEQLGAANVSPECYKLRFHDTRFVLLELNPSWLAVAFQSFIIGGYLTM
jgi:hypothetical protein